VHRNFLPRPARKPYADESNEEEVAIPRRRRARTRQRRDTAAVAAVKTNIVGRLRGLEAPLPPALDVGVAGAGGDREGEEDLRYQCSLLLQPGLRERRRPLFCARARALSRTRPRRGASLRLFPATTTTTPSSPLFTRRPRSVHARARLSQLEPELDPGENDSAQKDYAQKTQTFVGIVIICGLSLPTSPRLPYYVVRRSGYRRPRLHSTQ